MFLRSFREIWHLFVHLFLGPKNLKITIVIGQQSDHTKIFMFLILFLKAPSRRSSQGTRLSWAQSDLVIFIRPTFLILRVPIPILGGFLEFRGEKTKFDLFET